MYPRLRQHLDLDSGKGKFPPPSASGSGLEVGLGEVLAACHLHCGSSTIAVDEGLAALFSGTAV
jgi:hypothetical protein